MRQSEFDASLAALSELTCREDFQTALYGLYESATSVQRDSLRAASKAGRVALPKNWKYPTDYRRSDLPREQRMRQSLIAMSLQDGGRDSRDDLMSIAYCYHNLALMGIDADQVLREVAKMSSPRFETLVLNFVRRAPDEKSPKAFGLQVVETPEGPGVEFTM